MPPPRQAFARSGRDYSGLFVTCIKWPWGFVSPSHGRQLDTLKARRRACENQFDARVYKLNLTAVKEKCEIEAKTTGDTL